MDQWWGEPQPPAVWGANTVNQVYPGYYDQMQQAYPSYDPYNTQYDEYGNPVGMADGYEYDPGYAAQDTSYLVDDGDDFDDGSTYDSGMDDGWDSGQDNDFDAATDADGDGIADFDGDGVADDHEY